MSKSRAAPSVQPQSTVLSTQSAIYLLNSKIQSLEESHRRHMSAVETKFGEQDAYVSDNIPDLDALYKAISSINSRLLDFESLETRIAALETASGTAPPPPKAASKKRGGTVKLDLEPVLEPGVSFS